ncbi:MAG: 50S ribosomal protein L10 [Chitinophagaceae bacterium]|nr:MAG: 50S ribosomal protein L10 [Chitinophagaceae bacterium]
MTKEQKNEVIVALKEKFSQYDNFYVTNTESLSVDQISKLRRACFDKKVEMKVAKNTLIRKALEGLGAERFGGVFDSLNNVTALLFSENPKEPALIISSFRDASKGERPELKAAFINGDIYTGDNNLKALTKIKTKNELIGEVIGLLQSPASRVLAALQNFHETGGVIRKPGEEAPAPAPAAEAAPEAPAAEAAAPEAPAAEAPAAPEASAPDAPEAPKAEGEAPAAE